MNEEREKVPAVRPENAPAIKEEAQVPMEKPKAQVPAETAAPEAAAGEAAAPAELKAEEKTVPEEIPAEPAAEEEEKQDEVHVGAPEAEVEIHIIDDRDQEAESLIRWAAARAGVIVVTPVLGTAALVANEVYMISRIGAVYGEQLNKKAVLSFIGSLGATVVGSTLATMIPLSFMQLPIGVSVTYGVGKAAQKWIKDGMPDDTKPYREVFEQEKEKGRSEAEELENNPRKEEPLGDEKKDFLKDMEKNWDEFYPDKAHDAVDRLADKVTETAGAWGEKFVAALKKVGVTDEQLEKAKYMALGASEVAQETAEKTARDLQAVARIKSREFKKDAVRKADEMRVQARNQVKVLKSKSEEMKYQSEMQRQQMKLQSEKLKAQARVQMQDAKIKAHKLQMQAKEQADQAQARMQEISDKMKEARDKYRSAAETAAKEAKENFRSTAEEYRARIEERAEAKRAEAAGKEAQNAKTEAVESSAAAEKPAGEGKE